MATVHELMQQAGNNQVIVNAFAKTWDILDRFRHPLVSISGGADSDVMLDLIWRLDEKKKCEYVWFNTGLEYQATKDHLVELEQKYGIELKRIHAIKPIPQAVKEYGQPFISRNVSKQIRRLQKVGFDFKDGHVLEEDLKTYHRCKDALDWWHNVHTVKSWNINRNKHLKEFLIANPPTFAINDKCCYYTKKLVAYRYIKENNCDLSVTGIRKAEGGTRDTLTSCFIDYNDDGYATFHPIFWFRHEDKKEYCRIFGVTHSRCYTEYGMLRTGCGGCPFNRRLFIEIEQIRQAEGGLIQAAQNVFADSYAYTKKYREFFDQQQEKEQQEKEQQEKKKKTCSKRDSVI